MNISIRETLFYNINNGYKNIEVRLYRGIFESININDIVTFCYNDNKITRKINNLKLYSSFEELYDKEDINNITPNINSKDEFLKHYKSIYKKYNLNNFKVIALFI